MEIIPVLAPVLIFLAIMVFAFAMGRSAMNKQKDGMKGLADDLGLELIGGDPLVPGVSWLSWICKPCRIESVYKGRQLKIFTFTRGSGKNQTRYAAIHVPVRNPQNLRISLTYEGFLSKVGRSLGMQDIQTGDPAFDKLFILKSKQPEFAQAVLIPELRAQFIKAYDEHAARGTLKLDDDMLVYEEVGSLGGGPARRRFGVLAPACCQFADAIEVYSEAVSS